VQAAAQEYFGKSLDELSIAEAAALAVPIRNPPSTTCATTPTTP